MQDAPLPCRHSFRRRAETARHTARDGRRSTKPCRNTGRRFSCARTRRTCLRRTSGRTSSGRGSSATDSWRTSHTEASRMKTGRRPAPRSDGGWKLASMTERWTRHMTARPIRSEALTHATTCTTTSRWTSTTRSIRRKVGLP